MIQMIQRILPRNPSRGTVANRPRVEITRRWVETADERCPLACVWFDSLRHANCASGFRTEWVLGLSIGLAKKPSCVE